MDAFYCFNVIECRRMYGSVFKARTMVLSHLLAFSDQKITTAYFRCNGLADLLETGIRIKIMYNNGKPPNLFVILSSFYSKKFSKRMTSLL